MRKWFFILFCGCAFNLCAQTLQGTVYGENRTPIAGANVYLDGSTFATITDAEGKYNLILAGKINTTLVVSYLGYETAFIAKPFENSTQIISLVRKTEQLKEVVVTKEAFSRADKLAVFRAIFLGTTKAGKLCYIQNEDDIAFSYDYDKNVLIASSDVPLLIKNKYLGYNVQFNLVQFNARFTKKSIKSSDVDKSLFTGTALFFDVAANEKTKMHREEVYEGSASHFFKCLINNTLDVNYFFLYRNKLEVDSQKVFKVEKQSSVHKITVLDSDADKASDNFNFYATLVVSHTKKSEREFELSPKFIDMMKKHYKKSGSTPASLRQDIERSRRFNFNQSKIIFTTDSFYVDDFGNYSNIEDIIFSGDLGQAKFGDALPLNYKAEN